MKIVTWNCRIGAFRKKARQLVRLIPDIDILAVQEVEQIDGVDYFAEECRPTFCDRMDFPALSNRSSGMFSYTGMKLEAVDGEDPMFSFRRYEAHNGGWTINVVGVWTYATKSSATSYRQAHDGLSRHSDWIRQRPTIMLGDFNSNASFKRTDWKRNWQDLVKLTDSLGLVSAYHFKTTESFGAEKQPTHFHLGKETSPFHLDYCFLPGDWTQHIKSVKVGTYEDWHEISDHAPMIVEIDLPPME